MNLRISLHNRIFLGMLLGIAAGIGIRLAGFSPDTIGAVIRWVKPVGDVFLRVIFMTLMPLLVSALSLGIAEIGDIRRIGRIGLRTLWYCVFVSAIAVFIGIALVTLLQPGGSLSGLEREQLIRNYPLPASLSAGVDSAENAGIMEAMVRMVPRNPLEDMVRAFDPSYSGGGILAVIFFSLMIGIALSMTDPDRTATLKGCLEGVYEVTMKIIGMAMKLAPFGVASMLFCLCAEMGFSIILILSKYVLVVLLGLALHQFVTYPVLLKLLGKMDPKFFFRNTADVMLMAFSTSSSNATLPATLQAATQKLKLPRDISRFVLTVGSTANQNGTALYEGVTVLFLAQCFGMELPFSRQVFVVLLAIMAGIGTAGVPGGSLPAVMMILAGIGLPAESIGIIIGVDRLLDMSRTVLNVTGDLTAAVYVSRFEDSKMKT